MLKGSCGKALAPFPPDGADFVLMAVGAVAALANGVSSPLMIVIFGDIMDALGETANTNEIVPAVSKVAIRFIYLGVGTCVASCHRWHAGQSMCLNQDGSQKTSSLFRSRKAAATVEQTIGAIRTVAAFTGEVI
ncbi:hypothetical protein J5N97_013518 [Dioscorea zingiberensis]|uniref:ABC transmembrane type-1 domain-containing protein n=1 Tax=Dioscorea zingiberensis TaxID=325984 RepID=A0A9D5CSE6_9LILI|nr:hypothetical protein J5N97_013518 [Dioscorea zingiberensis]